MLSSASYSMHGSVYNVLQRAHTHTHTHTHTPSLSLRRSLLSHRNIYLLCLPLCIICDCFLAAHISLCIAISSYLLAFTLFLFISLLIFQCIHLPANFSTNPPTYPYHYAFIRWSLRNGAQLLKFCPTTDQSVSDVLSDRDGPDPIACMFASLPIVSLCRCLCGVRIERKRINNEEKKRKRSRKKEKEK